MAVMFPLFALAQGDNNNTRPTVAQISATTTTVTVRFTAGIPEGAPLGIEFVLRVAGTTGNSCRFVFNNTHLQPGESVDVEIPGGDVTNCGEPLICDTDYYLYAFELNGRSTHKIIVATDPCF